MKRLESDKEERRRELEMKRLAKEESEEERRSIRERSDQGRVCVPTIVVSFFLLKLQCCERQNARGWMEVLCLLYPFCHDI